MTDDWSTDDWYWEVIPPYNMRHHKQIIDVEFEDIVCRTKALIVYDENQNLQNMRLSMAHLGRQDQGSHVH